tara:strand:+ start:418 stop:648 length:231 start_codon:yes stop_codon:yes gene_type:complete
MSVTYEYGSVPSCLQYIRDLRKEMLSGSDWTQANDSPLSDSKKAEWASYRQELRDLPSKYTNDDSPSDVVWPTMPT